MGRLIDTGLETCPVFISVSENNGCSFYLSLLHKWKFPQSLKFGQVWCMFFAKLNFSTLLMPLLQVHDCIILIPPYHEEELVYIEGGRGSEQTARGDCGASRGGGIPNPSGWVLVSPALGDPVVAEGLIGCLSEV